MSLNHGLLKYAVYMMLKVAHQLISSQIRKFEQDIQTIYRIQSKIKNPVRSRSSGNHFPWSVANMLCLIHFLKTKMTDIGPFVWPLISLFWTSHDVCSGFQSQGRSLACGLCCLHAKYVFPRFTSDATHADFLVDLRPQMFY